MTIAGLPDWSKRTKCVIQQVRQLALPVLPVSDQPGGPPVPDIPFFRLLRRRGRLFLCLALQRQGQDWLACLSGGQAHIGAVALALSENDAPPRLALLSRPGHREDALAQDMARQLAAASRSAVCVCAGIHYPAISPEEIATVLHLCQDMTHEAAGRLAAMPCAEQRPAPAPQGRPDRRAAHRRLPRVRRRLTALRRYGQKRCRRPA